MAESETGSTSGKNEKFTVSGSQIVEKIKQIIREGNVRRVRLIHDGKTIFHFGKGVYACKLFAGYFNKYH